MDALSRALDEVSGSRINLSTVIDEHLGLRLRCEEAERWIVRHIPNARRVEDGALEAPPPNGATRRRLLACLSRIATRPLTGRMVTQALVITNQERMRWTKDGRLPTMGTARIRKGQIISIPTYDVETIASLAGQPELISSWREEDTAAQTHKDILICS